ncbi:hypothetical protein GCM10023157_25550 [Gluconacetobacter asukensis]
MLCERARVCRAIRPPPGVVLVTPLAVRMPPMTETSSPLAAWIPAGGLCAAAGVVAFAGAAVAGVACRETG